MVNPPAQDFISGVTHAHDEVRTDALANRGQDVERELQAILERPAIGAVQRVGQR